MFETVFIFVSFIVGVNIFQEAVVPAAASVNKAYIQPATKYATEKVVDGVDYVKEKVSGKESE